MTADPRRAMPEFWCGSGACRAEPDCSDCGVGSRRRKEWLATKARAVKPGLGKPPGGTKVMERETRYEG